MLRGSPLRGERLGMTAHMISSLARDAASASRHRA
jgi:hypothetical protein